MNRIEALGTIWWPVGEMVVHYLNPSPYDVENMRDQDGHLTRDSIYDWLASHLDFMQLVDFTAYIKDEVDLDWEKEGSLEDYLNCTSPQEAY